MCILLTWIGAGNACAQEILRIATGEFPPYYSESESDNGETLNIVKQAFAQMNIKVEYGFFPWNRSYELAKRNDWDASCCWHYTPERARDFNYSEVVRAADIVFFHLKQQPFNWQSLQDLTDKRIGVRALFTYGKEFEAAKQEGKLWVEQAPTDEINFRKLLGGRIDLLPIDKNAGYYLLSKEFQPEKARQVVHYSKPLIRYRLRLFVSKTHKQSRNIIDTFNEGLKRLKASGKYNQYFAELEKAEDPINQ